MKNIIKKVVLLLAVCLFPAFTHAQEKKKEVLTIYFKVAGNCEQCKKRIENAADIKGVKTSSWDEDTKILKVIYRADKVSEKQIKEAVAKSGHDAETFLATEATYNKLPGCCKYRDRKCEEKK